MRNEEGEEVVEEEEEEEVVGRKAGRLECDLI